MFYDISHFYDFYPKPGQNIHVYLKSLFYQKASNKKMIQ